MSKKSRCCFFHLLSAVNSADHKLRMAPILRVIVILMMQICTPAKVRGQSSPVLTLQMNVNVDTNDHLSASFNFSCHFAREQFIQFYQCLCGENTQACTAHMISGGIVTYTLTSVLPPSPQVHSQQFSKRYRCVANPAQLFIHCERLMYTDLLCSHMTGCISYQLLPDGPTLCPQQPAGIIWNSNQSLRGRYDDQFIQIQGCDHGCVRPPPTSATTTTTSSNIITTSGNPTTTSTTATSTTATNTTRVGPKDGQHSLPSGKFMTPLSSFTFTFLSSQASKTIKDVIDFPAAQMDGSETELIPVLVPGITAAALGLIFLAILLWKCTRHRTKHGFSVYNLTDPRPLAVTSDLMNYLSTESPEFPRDHTQAKTENSKETGTASSPNFGKVSDINTTNRQIQLGNDADSDGTCTDRSSLEGISFVAKDPHWYGDQQTAYSYISYCDDAPEYAEIIDLDLSPMPLELTNDDTPDVCGYANCRHSLAPCGHYGMETQTDSPGCSLPANVHGSDLKHHDSNFDMSSQHTPEAFRTVTTVTFDFPEYQVTSFSSNQCLAFPAIAPPTLITSSNSSSHKCTDLLDVTDTSTTDVTADTECKQGTISTKPAHFYFELEKMAASEGSDEDEYSPYFESRLGHNSSLQGDE